MTQFFGNNFTEDRWRKAALKNAFSLLGKQRFEHSTAFFLLAGHLKDAIEVTNMFSSENLIEKDDNASNNVFTHTQCFKSTSRFECYVEVQVYA